MQGHVYIGHCIGCKTINAQDVCYLGHVQHAFGLVRTMSTHLERVSVKVGG